MMLGTTAPSPASGKSLEPVDLIGVIIPWAIVLVAILLLAFFGLTWLSRRMGSNQDLDEKIGFTLEDLRQMRDSGTLTEEEFQKARAQMIEQVDPHAASSAQGDGDQAPHSEQ